MRTVAGLAVLAAVGAGVLVAGAAGQPPAPAVGVKVMIAPAMPAAPAAPAAKPAAPAAVPGGLAAAAGAAVTQAGTPPRPYVEPPISPEVVALVADLGAADYRTREKAGKVLEQRGERVLGDLRRAAAAPPSPEVGRRLAVLIRKMEHDRLVSPKRVTLSVKNRPAKEIFDAIAKQTGYRIEFQGANGRGDGKYSFELADVPFWVAMDKVAEATGLGVFSNNYDDETALQVNGYNGTGASPFVAYHGPFKFVAQNINANRTVQLANLGPGNPARPQEGVYLAFNIQSEPKNPILSVQQAELVSAVDDSGASLAPPKDTNPHQHFRQSYYSHGYRGFNFSSNLNLVRGGREATRITSLKGKVGLVLLAGTVPEVVIPDPLRAKAGKFTGRGVEVDFDSFTEANGAFTLSLTARKLAPDENGNVDYNWMNTVQQRIELVDAGGGKYRGYATNTNYTGNGIQLTMQFQAQDRQGRAQKLGPPARVVFNDWLQVTHEVPFEFKDLPLP